MNTFIASAFAAILAGSTLTGFAYTHVASESINRLGAALLMQSRDQPGNALVSPYSIQNALAMTYAGAAGATREELRRALFYPEDEEALHASFAALRDALSQLARDSEKFAEDQSRLGVARDPIALSIANRLFGQSGYPFREEFLARLADLYRAPLHACDFKGHHERERLMINRWVEEQTQNRIRDLIPSGGLNEEARLVLVNAIYLKAPWMEPFSEAATRPQPFWINQSVAPEVPTMLRSGDMRVKKGDGYTAVGIPYDRGDLQFVVVVPDTRVGGLAPVEAVLTAEDWSSFASAPLQEVRLYLPKFKLEPDAMRLGEALRRLGATSAFDMPPGSADFDRMAPRLPNEYLYMHEVFHKTFLEVDEKGTEAAAATAVAMMRATSLPVVNPDPLVIRVDRPFLFAIQHRPSGACLFMGRVRDPRSSSTTDREGEKDAVAVF